jgi:phosphopantetheine adenylyltransferase
MSEPTEPQQQARGRHVLVVANETIAGEALLSRLRARAEGDGVTFTVIAPINEPREGYVVYEDTRRAAARRRLERSLAKLREAGVHAHGFVADCEPVEALRDALGSLEPPVDEIVLSTYPEASSGWQRRNVVEQIRKAAAPIPVEHVVVDLHAESRGEQNVLVVANETVLGPALLERIRERAGQGPASFLVVAPQSDPSVQAHPQAERRLRQALVQLRSEGIDAHGQIAHPDPYAAAMHVFRDEHVDEIIVSTFAPTRSGWRRRDLVERLRKDTGLPVEHVVAEQPAEVS